MATPLRTALSHSVGWAAGLTLPRFLRAAVYKSYASAMGVDLSEVRAPLEQHPSLGAFFVRHLKSSARPIATDPALLISPVDGTVQSLCTVQEGTLLQAKGRAYPVLDLLGGVAAGTALEGGTAWTIYLSPRDYHRIHAPERCQLTRVQWIGGSRWSVAPKVLARRLVLPVNERVALRLETAHGPLFLVLVGATNVGRIPIVGVGRPPRDQLTRPLEFERGAELASFEMGSTIVLIAPEGVARARSGLALGQSVRLGSPIGEYVSALRR